MIKVYIGELIPGLPVTDLIRPNMGIKALDRWAERYLNIKKAIVEIVTVPEEADALLLPHNFNLVKDKQAYISSYTALAEKHKKKVLVFFPGDSAEKVDMARAIVFRNSVYRKDLLSNEIIMPGYVADLGASTATAARQKKQSRPKIGFCGWADYVSTIQRLKALIKSTPIYLGAFFSQDAILKQKGLWWRRRLLSSLASSSRVETNFIIRRTYSGNEKTLEIRPEQAKEEYVNNILSSDFTLCVKGDGNFSTRFYETLSLGRIPLFFDTDMVLPLENKIDYDSFVLRVDWKREKAIADIAADFFANLDNQTYLTMQAQARETFERFLALPNFLEYIFSSPEFMTMLKND